MTAATGLTVRQKIALRSGGKSDRPDALSATPADWQMQILRLVDLPGLEPQEASELRKWLAWRVLPPSYWGKVQAIAARLGGVPS